MAKLSFTARKLAKKYSKKKVQIAHENLNHRVAECDKIDQVLARVRSVILELQDREKNIIDRETVQEKELKNLIDVLERVLSSKVKREEIINIPGANVVPLGKKAEE